MSIRYNNDEEWERENDLGLDAYDEYVNRHYYDALYDALYDREPDYTPDPPDMDMTDLICPICWDENCNGVHQYLTEEGT
jgi:hypothetical protein